MLKANRVSKLLTGMFLAGFMLASHSALDMSQTPLLTLSGTVSPNLMFIVDDSGSMKAQFLYQYGGTGDGYGMPGPGVTGKQASCPSPLNVTTTCSYNAPSVSLVAGGGTTTYPAWEAKKYFYGDIVSRDGKNWICKEDVCKSDKKPGSSDRWKEYGSGGSSSGGAFYELSPDVNRMTYDPRVQYKVRLTGAMNADGTPIKATTPAAETSDFYVFFYKTGATTSGVWPGTGLDPKLLSSYFAPYTPAAALTNPDSVLAVGANASLSYPQCVGTTCSGGAGPFPKFANRIDCTGNDCTLAQERLNYAIWKKYHSNRMDLAKTGLGYAFQDIKSGLRIGWGELNNIADSTSNDLGSTGSGVSAIDQGTRRTDFYNWLYAIAPTGSTPLREALIAVGQYYTREDNLGPWANAPVPTSKGLSTLTIGGTDTAAARKAHASCRRSYTLMLTDGYYNDSAPTLADTDYTAITTITGSTPSGSTLTYGYDGRTKPYAAASTFTAMADIAMKYWITDLRAGANGLTNNVPVPLSGLNPSFWQNMGFYAVTLGVDGDLAQTQANLDKLSNGTAVPKNSGGTVPYWPDPPSGGNDLNTVDDLWHATVNGRGCILNARNADALADGVEGMLAEINRIESSQSGVAASAPSLKLDSAGGTYKYTPNYTTGTWVGNVAAAKLDPVSGAELCTKWRVNGSWLVDPTDSTKSHWYVGGVKDGTPDVPPCAGAPTSFNGIAAHGARTIYAWNGSTYGDFNASNSYVTSSTTGVASGKSEAADAALINYLRGDQSNEDPATARCTVATISKFRPRMSVLGDIVNSTPTFIKDSLNMNYEKLPSGTYGQASYTAFVAAKKARTEGVLFTGSNDGMVHGIRENTGQEVFAFVPRAAMPSLYQLSSKSYNHRYFVDGPTVEADACLTGGAGCATWTNMLLGTGGAGAKTVYAIDVTNPMSLSAASIKWEISPTGVTNSSGETPSTDYANLGNILTDVQTGLAMNGEWVAVFGNGYNGSSGASTNASLFVVNLNTGERIRELVVPTTIPVSGGNNGLGGVRLLRDDSQRIIAAYAGDLKGNLWKFDLSSTSAASWSIGITGTANVPLFKTADTTVPAKQPITATPAIVKHPLNGYVVAFGTGKLFEASDVSGTITQSLYGIWDSVTPPPVTQVDKTSLVQQTISAAITASSVLTNADLSTTTTALNYYSVSKNPVNWTLTSGTPRGWYIDLPNSGQRTIYPITQLVGKFFAVDTLSPVNLATNACVSSTAGKGWNYVIDMVTGGGPAEAIFDTNGDGIVSQGDGTPGNTAAADLLVSGYDNVADGRTIYLKNDTLSTAANTVITGLSTQQLPNIGISCRLANNCATKSTVKRTWRQLFMR